MYYYREKRLLLLNKNSDKGILVWVCGVGRPQSRSADGYSGPLFCL